MKHPQLPLGLALRDSARFTSYFPGRNREAVSHLRQAAEGTGERLVYLAGAAGLGKTHLLQAACHHAAGHGRAAFYLPLRDFPALSPRMLEGLEQLDLVCLDDVSAVAGSGDWEAGLFDLFNRVREGGATLLVTAEQRPDRAGFHLPDLVSRLGWGVTYVLRPLDDASVGDALQHRAVQRGLELPEETARFLMRRYPRDLASMCDLLERLDQASLAAQRRLTIPFVKAVLGAGREEI